MRRKPPAPDDLGAILLQALGQPAEPGRPRRPLLSISRPPIRPLPDDGTAGGQGKAKRRPRHKGVPQVVTVTHSVSVEITQERKRFARGITKAEFAKAKRRKRRRAGR